jgi:hypothetical protein
VNQTSDRNSLNKQKEKHKRITNATTKAGFLAQLKKPLLLLA